ncbi:hypothetical protein Dsin_002880 [Dipteronia sinensis]|uniref:Uncharacterized protein n=1 Tax=Dipteronia sinensis TaxID=43782 RepID=A0AAE0B7Y6_9ROSI|nr:hypothetical protein Dsin_002880 [Dipteronia sinensis]
MKAQTCVPGPQLDHAQVSFSPKRWLAENPEMVRSGWQLLIAGLSQMIRVSGFVTCVVVLIWICKDSHILERASLRGSTWM